MKERSTPDALAGDYYLARLRALDADTDAGAAVPGEETPWVIHTDDDPEEVDDLRPVEPAPHQTVTDRIRVLAVRHVKALAVVALVAVVVATWMVVRAKTLPVGEPGSGSTLAWTSTASPVVSAESPTAPDPPSPVAPTPEPDWRIHVLGAVVNPGVVTVPARSRVIDAIQAAGGLRPDADPAELNLAAVLSDGAQVVIGTLDAPAGEVRTGAAAVPAAGSEAPAATPASSLINLNTATAAELDTLPNVGPVTAGAILAWRDQHGRFNRVDELLEVDGIGPKTYAQIEPHVTV